MSLSDVSLTIPLPEKTDLSEMGTHDSSGGKSFLNNNEFLYFYLNRNKFLKIVNQLQSKLFCVFVQCDSIKHKVEEMVWFLSAPKST